VYGGQHGVREGAPDQVGRELGLGPEPEAPEGGG